LQAEEWDRIHHVNLRAVWAMTKLVCEAMKPHDYGRIVNISSIHSKVTEPGRTVYASTKGTKRCSHHPRDTHYLCACVYIGGINALTQASAVELAPWQILVNAVAPGFTRTEMSIINGAALHA
jgi:NAD(P)-dependent dehydrogenase (short-subunit alcohol dehydrogenase family)